MRRLCATLLLLSALAAPAIAFAQVAEGVVVGADGGFLGGVLVTALDAAGKERSRVISTPSGGFVLGVPSGTFRLSVSRIGFQRWYSPDHEVARGDTLRVRLNVDHVPLLLPELTALGESRCRNQPGNRASVLWEDARTALTAASATIDLGDVTYRTTEVLRRFSLTWSFQGDALRSGFSRARWPVESIDPRLLFDHGFVQQRADPDDLVYYGPDLNVLFDPAFLEHYCISAVNGAPGSGLTGVAFQPAGQGPQVAVRGTLWLDAASRQLRALEFFYVGLPRWVPSNAAGGRVEFVGLPDGRWLVHRWRMVAPQPRRTMAGIRVDAFVERDGAVVLALRQARDTIWTGPGLTGNLQAPLPPLPTVATPRAVGLRVERVKDSKARRIVAQNRSDSTQVVTALVLEQCVNVLERCAHYLLNERIEPGERRSLLQLNPWLDGKPFDFTARLEIDTTPAH